VGGDSYIDAVLSTNAASGAQLKAVHKRRYLKDALGVFF
jgi:hypothetical protein